MTIKLLIFAILSILTRTFKIRTVVDKFMSRSDTWDIDAALRTDRYFGALQEVDPLGQGTYGIAFSMRNTEKKKKEDLIAVKISNDNKIDVIPSDISPDILGTDSMYLSNRYANIRFLNYLKGFNDVPFLLRSLADRNIITYDNNKGSIVIKNLWAQELANKGDLYSMSRIIDNKSNNDSIKYGFLVNMMFKTLYAMNKINEHHIMHGDIKPENIFLKSCTFLGKEDICPVIGDWDLGYYYEAPPESFMSYTRRYRPLEMEYFNAESNNQDEFNRMFVSFGGYKYSRKEDVYALGATFIHVADLLKINLNDDEYANLRLLLTNMISPFEINDVLETIKLSASSSKKKVAIMLKNSIYKALDKDYLNEINKVNDCLNDVLRSRKISNSHPYIKESQEKSYNPAILFLRLQKFFEKIVSNDIILPQSLIKETEMFKFCKQKMKYSDPLKSIIAKRHTIKMAMDDARKLYLADINVQENIVAEDGLNVLPIEEEVEYSITAADRNQIFVAPSFAKKSSSVKIKICDMLPRDVSEKLLNDSKLNGEHQKFTIQSGTLEEICNAALMENKPIIYKNNRSKVIMNVNYRHKAPVYLRTNNTFDHSTTDKTNSEPIINNLSEKNIGPYKLQDSDNSYFHKQQPDVNENKRAHERGIGNYKEYKNAGQAVDYRHMNEEKQFQQPRTNFIDSSINNKSLIVVPKKVIKNFFSKKAQPKGIQNSSFFPQRQSKLTTKTNVNPSSMINKTQDLKSIKNRGDGTNFDKQQPTAEELHEAKRQEYIPI